MNVFNLVLYRDVVPLNELSQKILHEDLLHSYSISGYLE